MRLPAVTCPAKVYIDGGINIQSKKNFVREFIVGFLKQQYGNSVWYKYFWWFCGIEFRIVHVCPFSLIEKSMYSGEQKFMCEPNVCLLDIEHHISLGIL